MSDVAPVANQGLRITSGARDSAIMIAGAPRMSNTGDRTNEHNDGLKVSNGQGNCRGHAEKGHLCYVDTSVLGHSYFIVLPRPDSYLAFMYRGEMRFACVAIIGYAKSSQESVPVTLESVPPAFFAR